MYSFVNVPTLVRDLGRIRQGGAVAEELLRALALDRSALADLDATPYDAQTAHAVRDELVRTDRAVPTAMRVLAAARDVAGDVGLGAWSAAADVLERTPIGDLGALLRFVRDEVLAAAWTREDDLAVARWPRALGIVADGVAAAYTGDARLGAQWHQWCRAGRAQPAPTPWPDIVDAVRTVPSDADWPHPPAEWAALVHEACWAVHLTGRERAAAVTQLHALRGLLAGHPSPSPRAVATVVAAVHAHVVADVLDGDTHLTMTAPLFRLLP